MRIGRDLQVLARNLKELRYLFDRPDNILPGVEAGTPGAIERIEGEIGAIPLAIKVFWTHVGSVDFGGYHPEWEGCEYHDPLIVEPPSSAIAELEQYQQYLNDQREQSRPGFPSPYLLPIAPDAKHKENVSGGMWYNVNVPAVADDPPLNDEPHETTFMAYLGIALQLGGFPGLDWYPQHSWPLPKIRRGLSDAS